jgi:hypothetical protein
MKIKEGVSMSSELTPQVEENKREGREAATWRGHNMTRYRQGGDLWTKCHISTCITCGAEVRVLENPAPDEIEVIGDALATDCK